MAVRQVISKPQLNCISSSSKSTVQTNVNATTTNVTAKVTNHHAKLTLQSHAKQKTAYSLEKVQSKQQDETPPAHHYQWLCAKGPTEFSQSASYKRCARLKFKHKLYK